MEKSAPMADCATSSRRRIRLFLQPETRQPFGYAEIESEEQWASIASTEFCRKWWKQNIEIMPTNPDHSPVSAPLREVFHLS